MDKLKPLSILALASFIAVSCEVEQDGMTPGEFNYMIVNTTNHNITIITNPLVSSLPADTFFLTSQDTIISKGYESQYGDPSPLPSGDVYLTFDGDFTYKCSPNKEDKCMVDHQRNYECLENGPKVYKYIYLFTEEDYEYAKAHPYEETTE